MDDQTKAETDYIKAAGWHSDAAEPRRFRHADYPHLDPQTLAQAVEIVRNSENRSASTGQPPRTH